MAFLLKKSYEGYIYLMEDASDPRSNKYMLSSSVLQPLIVCLIYLQLVKKTLPDFMKDKPPYDLKKVMVIFNLSQVLANLYIVVVGIEVMYNINWDCATIDFSNSHQGLLQLHLVFIYFLTKIMDLLDTIFFVLRKKTGQVTFLHVYHHFGMVLAAWVGMKFLPGGHSIFLGYLNAIVHVCMYSYYLLSAWDDKYRELSAAFKKHITHVQLLQFTLLAIIYGRLLFRDDCKFPKIVSYFLTIQSIYFTFLFGDFYYKAYIKAKKPTQNNGQS